MTPKALKEIISEELNEKDINNWHGITMDTLDRFLIEPKIIELSTWNGPTNKYWLVSDELPDDAEEGYQVVYDEREDMFGLVTKTTNENKNIGYLVGLYGSFTDALKAM
jgi:hypothetical protein